MQLSPHTLFNLLHTIRGHIEWDPKGAQAMVVQLADLLRRLLNAGERDFSRLTDELQFVGLYLELQQKRFADRLTVELPAPEDIVDAWVPSLILQPLVENAVVHGLAGHQGPVEVRVARRTRRTNAHVAGRQYHRAGQDGRRRRDRTQQRARAAGRAVRGPGAARRRDRPGRNGCSEITMPRDACLRPSARNAAGAWPPGRPHMNVIIVDDEQAGRRTLREYCEAERDLQGDRRIRRRRRPRSRKSVTSGRSSCFSTFRWIR